MVNHHALIKQNPATLFDGKFLVDASTSYFGFQVLPEFKSSLNKNTAIFIPSYFDFVRIRNHFKKEEINFLQINEYAFKPRLMN